MLRNGQWSAAEVGEDGVHTLLGELPYPTMPPAADGKPTDSAANWPGFHAFQAFIGEAFGPRQPSWTMEKDIAGYYARMQHTLQAGRAGYDIAVLNQVIDGGTATHDGSFLVDAGYTYGYVTPGSLAGQPVVGGVLAPGGGRFKALVVDSSPTDLETAREIARVARAGLPLIIVGDGPQRTIGYAPNAAAQDEAVREAFARIARRPNVTKVADDAGALAELARRGLRPAADIADKGVTAVARQDGRNTYHVLINRTNKAVTTTAALTGAPGAVPYTLDPWTGKIAPIGSTRTRTSLTVSLPAGAAKIIALAGRTFAGVQHPATASATAQAAQPLGNWTLTLDEWLPGGPGDRSSVTRHREHAFANVPLKSWTEIPSIKDAVGVGSYFTTFQAPAAEQLGAVVDLGTLIKPGRNTIRVEVASTLLNRLRVHRPAEFGSRAPAITGLLGPVTLIPY